MLGVFLVPAFTRLGQHTTDWAIPAPKEWSSMLCTIVYRTVLVFAGLGQCAELVWQLRGEAGKRQVEGARVAMQHNFGIGGAAVVTMYRKYQPSATALQARL